ncbi:MAG TPA: STAS domain-containing protein [Micromonosporaceae bacterium]|jgi:anti-anti-sigma factor
MHFIHELSADSGHACLVLRGEIDLAVRDDFRATLKHAVGLSHGLTEVDLHGVTFLDCAAIGVLVTATETAGRRGRAVIVTHPWGVVRRLLELTDVLPRLSASSASGTPAAWIEGHHHEPIHRPV